MVEFGGGEGEGQSKGDAKPSSVAADGGLGRLKASSRGLYVGGIPHRPWLCVLWPTYLAEVIEAR